MSRTYRRKNQKKFWNWYKSEEEFNIDRDLYIQECPKPVITKQPPGCAYWKMEDWMSGYAVAKAKWNEWYSQFKTQEYLDYQHAAYFASRYHGKLDYKEYMKACISRGHSDVGVGDLYLGHGPHWYCNLFLERPLRRAHKQEIHHAIRNNYNYDEMDVVLTPYNHESGYYW